MTRLEKFALARAFFDNAMDIRYPAQVRQQFDVLVNGVLQNLFNSDEEKRQFRAIIARDNWLRDNPFKDDIKE